MEEHLKIVDGDLKRIDENILDTKFGWVADE
jgi:hypothetical protein